MLQYETQFDEFFKSLEGVRAIETNFNKVMQQLKEKAAANLQI